MILLIICSVVSVLLYFYHFPIVEVVGDSMFPTYKNGEFLKAHRLIHLNTIKEGKVYVYKTSTGEVVIKRLNHISPYGLFFIGDNLQCSFDSRSYGYVPIENVIAEIIEPIRKE